MSNLEGLFCEEEGTCVCGNDCFNPGPYTCGALTYRQTRDSPAEYCETEVEHQGEPCAKHEEPDDNIPYERWKDSRYDD